MKILHGIVSKNWIKMGELVDKNKLDSKFLRIFVSSF